VMIKGKRESTVSAKTRTIYIDLLGFLKQTGKHGVTPKQVNEGGCWVGNPLRSRRFLTPTYSLVKERGNSCELSPPNMPQNHCSIRLGGLSIKVPLRFH